MVKEVERILVFLHETHDNIFMKYVLSKTVKRFPGKSKQKVCKSF